jgi:hypothetical protein
VVNIEDMPQNPLKLMKKNTTEGFTLPDAVVVGGRDKKTVDLYKKEIEKLKVSEKNPYIGLREFAEHYAKMQMAKKYGVPKVRPNEPISTVNAFIRNRAGIETDKNELVPHYNNKTIYGNFNDYKKDYIPELAHYVSDKMNSNGRSKRLMSMFLQYAKGNNPYKTKGTEEYYAHSEIQPVLNSNYKNFYEEGKSRFLESARNSIKRKEYEKNKK